MLYAEQLEKPGYKNWIKGTIGLQFLKQGIKGVTERILIEQHTRILQRLPEIIGNCEQCTIHTLVPFHKYQKKDCPGNQSRNCICKKSQKGRRPCPNNEFCSKFYDEIVLKHRFKNPQWNNTDLRKWKTDPWSVATCFINTCGYNGKDAETIDTSGLLCIIINNIEFELEFENVTIDGKNDDFKQAKDARNDLLHSENFEMSDTDLQRYIDLFKRILEHKHIAGEEGAQSAHEKLEKLKDINITTTEIHESDQLKLQELKQTKISMIEDIVKYLKETENQGRSFSVTYFDSLLRHHLLLKHACLKATIAVLKREEAKRGIPLVQLLLSQKDSINQRLDEDELKVLYPDESGINTSLGKMGVSLICKLILSLFVNGKTEKERSLSLTRDETDAIHYILEQTQELKSHQSSFTMDRTAVSQKYKRVQDAALVLLEAKTGESENDSKNRFDCKKLVIKYLYKLKNVDTLSNIMRENVDRIDFKVLNKLTKTMPKDMSINDEIQDAQNMTMELMLALSQCMIKGKELETPEDFEGIICIHCISETISNEANETFLNCTLELVLNKDTEIEPRKLPEHTENAYYYKLKPVVSHLLSLLVGIAGTYIYGALRGSTRLQIKCETCEAMYKVLALINSPRFQESLLWVQTVLEQETGETFEVFGNITIESLQTAKTHLIEQDVIEVIEGEVTCQHHPDKSIDNYCPRHEQFCCETCLETEHRMCVEQLREVNMVPVTLSDDVMYNTKTKEDMSECWIRGSTVLANGDILLADYNNSKLKKLNSSFLITSHCRLPDKPSDVCYVGDGIAAVSLLNSTIQFVSIKEELKIEEEFYLSHPCYGLFYSDPLLYITDDNSVYIYSRGSTQETLLYQDNSGGVLFRKIAVSDDGERIYITNINGSLVTIDKRGRHISTLRNKKRLNQPEDVCISDKHSVIVCCFGSEPVVRVEYNGEMILETVIKDTDGLHDPCSVSTDRQNLKLIVGEYGTDNIIVFPLYK